MSSRNYRKRRLGLAATVGYLLIVSPAYAHENHNEAPWAACEAQQQNSSCEFSDGHGDLYRGSCQVFSDSLMCVRNQPIVRADAPASKTTKSDPAPLAR